MCILLLLYILPPGEESFLLGSFLTLLQKFHDLLFFLTISTQNMSRFYIENFDFDPSHTHVYVHIGVIFMSSKLVVTIGRTKETG